MTWSSTPPTTPGWYFCRTPAREADRSPLVKDGWFTYVALVHHEYYEPSRPLMYSAIWFYGAPLRKDDTQWGARVADVAEISQAEEAIRCGNLQEAKS